MHELFNFAYLDPSTGSIVIQSLIGVIAGVTVFGRNAIMQMRIKAKRLFSKDDKPEVKVKAKAETKQ